MAHNPKEEQRQTVIGVKRIAEALAKVELLIGVVKAVRSDEADIQLFGSVTYKTVKIPRQDIEVRPDDTAIIARTEGSLQPILLLSYRAGGAMAQSPMSAGDNIAPPVGIEALSFAGGVVGLQWQAVNALSYSFDVEWQKGSEVADLVNPLVRSVYGSYYLIQGDAASLYWFRVRTVNAKGRKSGWSNWYQAQSAAAGTITTGGQTSTEVTIPDGSITNLQVATNAAIAISKLAGATAGSVFVWDSSGNPYILPPSPIDGQAIVSRGVGQPPEYRTLTGTLPTGDNGDLITFSSGTATLIPVGAVGDFLGVVDSLPAYRSLFTAVLGLFLAGNGISITDDGTNITLAVSSTIYNHPARTDNPHGVTAAQVGKDTAQWNANKLQGQTVASATPADNQVLTFVGGQWAAADPTGGTLTPVIFQEQTTIATDTGLRRNESGWGCAIGQAFTIPTNETILRIEVALKKTTSAALGGTLVVTLHYNNGAVPGTVVQTGTPSVNASELTTSYQWFAVEFNVTLNAGTVYHLVVSAEETLTGDTNSDFACWGGNSAGSAYTYDANWKDRWTGWQDWWWTNHFSMTYKMYAGQPAPAGQVAVSADDTTLGLLQDKLTAGANITLTVINGGGDEQLEISASGGGGGVTDHGALTGLGDDDHTQYHNDTRGDARYSQLGHTHAASDIASGQLPLARGGTGADLSATGGTGQVLKQSSVGGAISVATIGSSDLPVSGVSAGSYTNANLTVDDKGRITAASNGSAGASTDYVTIKVTNRSGGTSTIGLVGALLYNGWHNILSPVDWIPRRPAVALESVADGEPMLVAILGRVTVIGDGIIASGKHLKMSLTTAGRLVEATYTNDYPIAYSVTACSGAGNIFVVDLYGTEVDPLVWKLGDPLLSRLGISTVLG